MRLLTVLAVSLCALSVQAGSFGTEIEKLYVRSFLDEGRVEIHLALGDEFEGKPADYLADLVIAYPDGSEKKSSGLHLVAGVDGDVVVSSEIAPVIVWHPRTPNLYSVRVEIKDASGTTVLRGEERFGIRKLEHRDARFYVNNEPFFVRACGHEQEQFCDELDRAGALKRLRQVRRYGFNAVRHHSHVPSEVYLDAADEVGVFIQMEIKGKIGSDPQSERFAESKHDWMKMVEVGRRHPCVFIYSMGNEIYKNDPGQVRCQNELYDLAKSMDPIPLVLNRSGSNPFNDDHGKFDLIERPIGEYEHVALMARDALMLYLRGDRKGRSDQYPIIAHEYPLVAAYPNVELIHKYKETPEWLQITLDSAKEHGIEHLLPDFARNAQKIQTVCRKEMLEEARKFRELDGYSMLRFTDNMDKVSGVVDDFSDAKDITATEFLRTNGQTVLVCTWEKRNFRYGETVEAVIEISHHGPKPYSAKECRWMLMNGYTVLAEGAFDSVKVGAVDVATVGRVRAVIPKLDRPAKLTLRAFLPDTKPFVFNEWPCWAFGDEPVGAGAQKQVVIWDPRKRLDIYRQVYGEVAYVDDEGWQPASGEKRLIVTDSWQDSFYDFVDGGGRLWVISDKVWPWPEEVGIFGLHITRMSPEKQAPVVFPELDEDCTKWMTICSNAKYRTGNSGTLIYPHPAMGDFPHEGFCDLQFWPMVYRAKSLHLDRFPEGTGPVIRTIDNYYRGRSKAYMAELSVGKGAVFVSTLNLTQFFSQDAATAYLFDQVLRYLLSERFVPGTRIDVAALREMLDKVAAVEVGRAPQITNELRARYTTRWKSLLSDEQLISLPLFDAEGVDESRLAVHWEYAQTQWYLNGQPGDQISWEFEADRNGPLRCTLPLAGVVEDVAVMVQLDDQDAMEVWFDGSGAWQSFKAHSLTMPDVAKGKHRLTLSMAADSATVDGRCIQIGELELRGGE